MGGAAPAGEGGAEVMIMTNLLPGDFAPNFVCASTVNPEFAFDTVGGWRTALCFLDRLDSPLAAQTIEAFQARRGRLRANLARILLVSADPTDDTEAVRARLGELKLAALWDGSHQVARLFGVEGWRGSIVLDENLRFVAARALDDPSNHVDAVLAAIEALPPFPPPRTIQRQAPALIVPDVFDHAFCRGLVDHFEAQGGRDSGFMNEVEGRTVGVLDHRFKRRRDVSIDDEALRGEIMEIMGRRIRPEVRKGYATNFTRIERFLIARYDAETRGHFNAHRDNTTPGTAHRKFAVTINLNAEDYEGGDLCFPEYGRDSYRAPTGGAVVFSCGLLHEALPVTKGRRYAFLPFLYDEAGWRLRQATRDKIDVSRLEAAAQSA
jgi:predicted 2-oxoglutarate/Fe(II)-dependent dioxygenase YbiX/peroxiredoxin